MSVFLRGFEKTRGMHSITKWPGSELRQLARVSVGKWDDNATRREICQARQRVGRKARFRLFAVGDYGRARASSREIVSPKAAS